jgi:hypothetical protein
MEVICSSETSVDTQWTTQHYIPEDGTLQLYRKLGEVFLKFKKEERSDVVSCC